MLQGGGRDLTLQQAEQVKKGEIDQPRTCCRFVQKEATWNSKHAVSRSRRRNSVINPARRSA